MVVVVVVVVGGGPGEELRPAPLFLWKPLKFWAKLLKKLEAGRL